MAPARGGEPGSPITYAGAPGEDVVIRGSEVLTWKTQPDGTHLAALDDSLFDTLDGNESSPLYNPFRDPIQPDVGCSAVTTGQVFASGSRLVELGDAAAVPGCQYSAGCFAARSGGKELVAKWPAGSSASDVEVTVRSRVFAPHRRGLAHVVVQGFTMEHAANQWIANFWFPKNAKYSQSGLLGTRSGYMWTIRNNTLRQAQTIALDIGTEGGYPGSWPPPDNEGTEQPTPNVTGNHTVEHNVIEYNGASGIQGYMTSGTVSFNIFRSNGFLGCDGAENAVMKTHGFSGVMEGNVIIDNPQMPIWFDGGWHDLRFTRNAILWNEGGSNGVDFELSDGPALFDNNIVISSPSSLSSSSSSSSLPSSSSSGDDLGTGAGGGAGVVGMDASGVTATQNLLLDFESGAFTIFSLTGRTCGGHTCGLRGWSAEANLLLTGAKAPWLRMHTQKHGSHGELLVTNDTLSHNLVAGQAPAFGHRTGPGGEQPEGVSIEANVDAAGAFNVSFDEASLTLTLQVGPQLSQSGCAPGGPGGDVDFTGARRSASQCVPGPVEGLAPGQPRTISLLPSAALASSATDSMLVV